MASQHPNMRKQSKGRAQRREDAVNQQGAAILSHDPNRVTPRFPREARGVAWKYGTSVSPSSSRTLAQIDKRPTTDFASKTSNHQQVIPVLLELFRAFLRVLRIVLV